MATISFAFLELPALWEVFAHNDHPHSGLFLVSAASRPQQAEAAMNKKASPMPGMPSCRKLFGKYFRLCYRKWLMLFSLKLQRDNRKNALAVDPAKEKTGKKAVFSTVLWR